MVFLVLITKNGARAWRVQWLYIAKHAETVERSCGFRKTRLILTINLVVGNVMFSRNTIHKSQVFLYIKFN